MAFSNLERIALEAYWKEAFSLLRKRAASQGLTFSELGDPHLDGLSLLVEFACVDETLSVEDKALEVVGVEGERFLTILDGEAVEFAHLVAASPIREVDRGFR